LKLLFKLVALLFLLGCRPYAHLTPAPNPLLALDTSYNKSNDVVRKLIAPYSLGLESEMNRVIGFCPAFLEKKKPSSALGSFMADAVLAQAKLTVPDADFCLLNYGGIRNTLDSGDVTVGDIFELMPFENEIVVLTISQSMLDTMKQFVHSKNGEPFSKELLNLPEKAFYKVATNDYIANGGDDYAFFINAEKRVDTNLKIRDALINYIEVIVPIEVDYAPREL
jgi:2',3'-cyclic-nucleotide 2'-phosphodiesterase (5'-nucleotidase family)